MMADRVLRPAFAATVALAAAGAYIALFASPGLPDPVHDQLLGLVLMGGALGISLVVYGLLLAVRLYEDRHMQQYRAAPTTTPTRISSRVWSRP